MPPMIAGFISFNKVWIGSFLVIKTLSMELSTILFIALDYWQSDILIEAIYCFVFIETLNLL